MNIFRHGDIQLDLPEGYRDASRLFFSKVGARSNIQITCYRDAAGDFTGFLEAYRQRTSTEMESLSPQLIRSESVSVSDESLWLSLYAISIPSLPGQQYQSHMALVQQEDIVVTVWTGASQEFRVEEQDILNLAAGVRLVREKSVKT